MLQERGVRRTPASPARAIGRQVLRRCPGLTRYLLRHWVSDPRIWEQSALEEFVQSSREPARAAAGQALHWQYVLHDIPALALGRNREHRLTVPTLLLAGAADPVVTPKLLQRGDRYAGDQRVLTVPRAGHLLPEERPDLVASRPGAVPNNLSCSGASRR